MRRLSQTQLHRNLIDALGASAGNVTSIADKPLDLDLDHPLPHRSRFYIFNATRPPGGRPTGEHKIQLIVPGQKRGERGDFDYSDGRTVFLAGYQSELDVFVLWDAGVYRNFSYSRNVQVKGETLYAAYAGQVCIQHRRTDDGVEHVIAAHRNLLRQAMQQRVSLSLDRLLGAAHA